MSAVENKEVVRRFLKEISAGGNLDLIDQLVAPDYTNRGLGNVDLAGFKRLLGGMQAASDVVIEDLVAEDDAVVVRSSMKVAVAGGEELTVRAITFYRLAGGRIVEDDTLTTPDLSQILGGSAPVLARD
ncbi:MAG TPA: nuclear transport factor 2 family protein [Candidatus Dormibacteraeota bacterium]|nr:nuclear transport factor 2 family protein [Candidatus Dormibacteraeota bacterium]